jgi:hypothetical protein
MSARETIPYPTGAAMNDSKLQDFITTLVAKRRITFGDVRRLSRDHLPAGVSNREEAKILIDLDAVIERTDRAWTDWLVTAVTDFALGSEQYIAADEVPAGEWLQSLLAGTEASTEAKRRITREIRREARRARQVTELPWEDDNVVAHAAVADVGESAVGTLQLAA